ncbi:MAG: chorismate synthase [Succinivibrio sp.]|nr:chorismate synthase [Succinivibrio sp.]
MPFNTLGQLFCVTTCGESHGQALLAIIDGCPPQIPLSEELIQPELDRRRPGSSRYGTPRNEADQVRIVSGVFEGLTTGTPIGLVIENTSQRSKDYGPIKDLFRPGHADYTYLYKYGIRDYRGGGRASARETAMRVAAGAVAKQVLKTLCNVSFSGCVMQIGKVKGEVFSAENARENDFNFGDLSRLDDLRALFKSLYTEHNSVGALVEVRAHQVPVGLGDPVFARLDAQIASAMMSIPAVKGVEIGDGFRLAEALGTEARDEIRHDKGFLSNHSGGTLGGISTGQDLIVRLALKPTSSIETAGQTVNRFGEDVEIETHGRHDPCVGIRAVPVAEAMLALTLADAYLCAQAQCGQVKERCFRIPT